MLWSGARRGVLVALLTTAPATVATAQERPPAPPPTPVTIGVAITNGGEDRYIEDLTAADLRLRENGRPQPITTLRRGRRPVSVCVVFDASMRQDQEEKRRVADATVRALAAALEPDDEIAVLVMRLAPDIRLPLTRAADVRAVTWGEVTPRGWGIGDSTLAALDVLDRARHPRRVVLHVTDGFFSGREVSLANLVTTRFRSETTVHAIEMQLDAGIDWGPGYMPVRDRRLVKPQVFDVTTRARPPDPSIEIMVKEGGGLLQQVGGVAMAEQAARNLANDLRFEYTLEYTPTVPQDGRYHRVTLEVDRRDTRLRHRTGYLAASPVVNTMTTIALPPVAADAPAAPAAIPPAPAPPARPVSMPRPDSAASARGVEYEDAINAFRDTADVKGTQLRLGQWSRDDLSSAVTAARLADPDFVYAAALFHFEVAYGVAPLSVDNARYHLRLGEQLLEPLPVSQSEDAHEFVGRWYAAAASIFLAQGDLTHAREVVGRGRGRVSASARLQFMVARIEDLAALRVDTDTATHEKERPALNLERRGRLAVAEQQYRQALKLEPAFDSAAVHLGRVLQLLDRPTEARPLLAPIAADAAALVGDRYLASLFLAADHERAGDVESARSLLEQIEIFAPGRQGAWLALSQLEQRAGRIDRARELVAAHVMDTRAEDEWWNYRTGGLQTEDLAWMRARLAR